MSAPLILAASCTFPSGSSIKLADAAVRAQLLLQQRHWSYRDSAGQPTRASLFPLAYPLDSSRWGMLMENALEQLRDSLIEQGIKVATYALHLWIVLPDATTRLGIPPDLEAKLHQAAIQATDLWQQITMVHGGHAAGVTALEQACELVLSKPGTLAIIIGVESGMSHDAMLWLDMQSLLHGAHHPSRTGFRTEAYGRIPGEGAAAVAIAANTANAVEPEKAWATLIGCATAHESITHNHSEPCTGRGMAEAARVALQQGVSRQAAPVGHITADLNGEPYRADQFGFTALRLGKALQDNWQRTLPALASGDLHAASAVAHVALAAYALAMRPSATSHLVLASSDDTLRGAVLLGATRPVTQQREVRPWRSPSTSMA